MLSLSSDDLATFTRLRNLLDVSRSETIMLNQYYEGDRRIRQLGLALPPEMLAFTVFLAWPRVTVDGCEQRLDVTGFRLPGQPADSYLWEAWQYNDLDELQSWAHTDALALARSYICVGTNPDDADHPLVTVESPLEMVTIRDPTTRKIVAALRMYTDSTVVQSTQTFLDTRATLYLPDATYWLLNDGGWQDAAPPDLHGLGVVPVVPMVNRDRPTRRTNAFIEGISEMADVIPIAESASRAITNAQLAQETHAVPHRWMAGVKRADIVDQNGNPSSASDLYFNSFSVLTDAAAKMGQLDASDMQNFQTIIDMYARLASGVTSMPIEYFGLNTQNAPSAEGQRAGETRLIKKAERKQVAFGHAWEAAMRLVLAFRDGVYDPDPALRGLEAIWRDAGTPTISQVSDAIGKQYAEGLVDWETAQEDLGRTPAQIVQMQERRINDMGLAVTGGIQAALVQAANGTVAST